MGGFRLFTLADIPVWVSPGYIFLLIYGSMRGGVAGAMVWTACVTISLIAHEMGHALTAKHYKLDPEIMLHGFGGRTGHRAPRTNAQEALIIAAGPSAGLLLWAMSYFALRFAAPQNALAQDVLVTLVNLNLFWSLFNLLPLWPMDGGQLFRLGMLKIFKPGRAEKIVHTIGVAMAALLALIASRMGYGMFTFLILAIMAWENVQALMAGNGQPVRRDNPRARELMTEAERAYQRGDEEEAARICHQLRAESQIPPQILARAWTILGVTTTRKGEYEEALSYLKRAPDSPEAVEATAQCFYQLEMYEALDALTKTRAFMKLPDSTREQIEKALSEAESAGAG